MPQFQPIFNFNHLNCEPRVHINVSGKKYELFEKQLEKFPNTLLGSPAERFKYYDRLRDEYFFDRNREAFEGIVYFYQSNGKFSIPLFVPLDVFYEEIQFFGLVDYINSECGCEKKLVLLVLDDLFCKIKLKGQETDNKELMKNEIKALKQRFSKENYFYEDYDDEENIPQNKYQKYLWYLFERPNSSLLGRIIAMVCLATVILSVLIMCLETLITDTAKSTSSMSTKESAHITNKTSKYRYFALRSSDDKYSHLNQTAEDPSIFSLRRAEFFIIELVCNSIFTIEIFIRIIAAPDRLKFLRNFTNIIDIVAIVPFWGSIIFNNLYHRFYYSASLATSKRSSSQYGLSVLRILRLTRILRVLKLSRHIRALNIMGQILYACFYEIILLVTFLAINIIIFSSLMYYIELYALGDNSPFISSLFFFAFLSKT